MTALTTLETLKAELGITGSASDARLTRLITHVSSQIETFLGRNLERRAVTDTFIRSRRFLFLTAWPVVGSVTVTSDGTALTSDQYVLDADEGILSQPVYGVGYGSPCGYLWYGTVTVDYTGGYLLPGSVGANLPGDIERAALDLAIRYHHVGGRDPTLRSETVPGVLEQSWSAIDNIPTVAGLPLDIANGLIGYKRAVL
jgi:hypothetical protein